MRPFVASPDRLDRRILLVRGQKVVLDADLARLYGVSNKSLKQAVRRNRERFPEDFLLELTWKEAEGLSRSQSVTLIRGAAFVRLRKLLATHAALACRLDALKRKVEGQFATVFDALGALMQGGSPGRIGFR